MTNQQPPNYSNQGNQTHYLIISLAVIFVVASLLMPDLVWILFAAFLISMVALYVLKSNAITTQIDSNYQNRHSKNESGLSTSQAALAEAFQFPVYILNNQGKIIYANQSSKDVFKSVNIGDQIFIRFRQPELRQLIEKALTSKLALTGEYNEPIPDDRWFSVEIAPITLQAKSLYILGFHDLTEAKRTDQMRSDFIANASHELRTPLASLLGYLETIKGPARHDEKAIDKFTDVMLDQAQRMKRLVNGLLSLSRLEMQSHVRPSKIVDLGEVISSVVASIGSVAKQLDVEIEYKEVKDLNILGDRDELVEVFENLIENACKYGEEGKKVIVTIDKDDQQKSATVSILDFGPGIAPEHQHRITERFYRVDVARSRAKQGTGLGLAIVKHILNRHATKLGMESKLNEGTRFFVTFSLVGNKKA